TTPHSARRKPWLPSPCLWLTSRLAIRLRSSRCRRVCSATCGSTTRSLAMPPLLGASQLALSRESRLMGKKLYEVTERSFINGRLCESGDRIELHIDSPGTNLREVGVTQGKMAPVSKVGTGQLNDGAGTGGQSTAPAAGDGYTAYHVGSGRYGIK